MAAARKNSRVERAPGIGRRLLHVHTRGQALVIVALVLTVLILFIGLGVDVGNMMARRAKLQSAVDSAVLSAAQELSGGGTLTQTAVTRANQILEASGIPSNTLNLSRTSVDFPAPAQVRMKAVQRVDTFFMRIIPLWQTVEISVEATADLNSYAEINTKPYGIPGVVNELNLMVWGTDSTRTGGDAYSPVHIGNGDPNTLNPWHSQMPYGYLYRIDVPANYPSDHLAVEIFDADGYNRPNAPPTWPVACGTPPPTRTPGATPTGTRTPTPTPCVQGTPTSADQYASCTNPSNGACTSDGAQADTALKLNAFSSGRPAFWRVDELRLDYTQGIAGVNDNSYGTKAQYTIWHFDPHITSAFSDPATLSDQSGGAYLARYTGRLDNNDNTDLSWYQPPGFNIALQDGSGNDLYARESTGGMYFYLYVQGISGSSENNFDLRVGPPVLNGGGCTNPSPANNCYVNKLYLSGAADWQDGGAAILAKRALPLNLDTGASFPLLFTQVSKNAAGQTLGVRHFDQDCNNGCGSHMQYQMSIGGCTPLTDDNCWHNIGDGYVGPNDGWVTPPHPDPEPVLIPIEGSSDYNLLFGASGQYATSWLRIQTNPSYSQDTTVWEMPFIRPRLIK